MKFIKDFIKLSKEKRVRIAVIGDAMLDEYYRVKVSRISPEFPIEVMLSENDEPYKVVPGGAANVAYQFSNLNVTCDLFCFSDALAKEVFSFYNLDWANKHVFLNSPIPRKKRFYDGNYAISRWDIEHKSKIKDESRDEIFNNFIKNQYDVVILSDYGKGLFDEKLSKKIINYCKENNIITIVDPKDDIDKWYGCDIFKPNLAEAVNFCGKLQENQMCFDLMNRLGCKSVIITKGADGAKGIVKNASGWFNHHSYKKIDANSVIGAGDCFAAFLALGIGLKLHEMDCMKIACEASAVYVQRKDNKPITYYDYLRHIDPIQAKFIEPDKIQRDGKLVFTNGCFDNLHKGHLFSLKYARNFGDKLVVAVNSDESVKRLKGDKRPIFSLEERMTMLANLEIVDYVVSFDEDTPYELIKQIMPDVLVKGGDWSNNIVGSDLVKEVHVAPILKDISTTKIIEKIKNDK